MPATASSRLLPSLLAAALVLSVPVAAQDSGGGSGGASYAGHSEDPVSGYPCVTPFCDTIRLPNTSCLCRKLNPGETRAMNLRYDCVDMRTRQQCQVSPN